MNLIIDVGNTRVKAAVFELDTIKSLYTFHKDVILSEIKKIVSKYPITSAIISAVATLSEEKLKNGSNTGQYIKIPYLFASILIFQGFKILYDNFDVLKLFLIGGCRFSEFLEAPNRRIPDFQKSGKEKIFFEL